MIIKYSKNYDKSIKKLKKHIYEFNNLLNIIKIIERVNDFNMLKKLPMVQMYRFEQLKYQNNNFYSFNLSKHSGTIRLIVKHDKENSVIIYLVDISYKHYEDFDCERVVL